MFEKSKVSLAVVFAFNCLWANAAPDAGSLSNQVKQERDTLRVKPAAEPNLALPPDLQQAVTPSQPGDTAVPIRSVVFTGDLYSSSPYALSESERQSIVRPFLTAPLNFQRMNEMAQALTQAYRDKGLPLARVILPAQTIKNETLSLQVLIGRYDQAQYKNASGLSDKLLTNLVRKQLPSGEVITKSELVRTAMLLGEIPGVQAGISLEPGENTGTSKPVIELQPGKKWGGYVGANNRGDRSTGRDHIEGAVYVNDLLGLGDQLLIESQDAYQDNDLVTGRIDYSLLVGDDGMRVGANYNHLNYSYSFQKLAFDGYSDTWNLYAIQPLIRTLDTRIDARLEVGQQFLKDNYPDELSTLLKLDSQGRKRVDQTNFSLSGTTLGWGGVSNFFLQATLGKLNYQNDTARYWNGSDLRDTEGAFFKLNYAVNHEQPLLGNLYGYAQLAGQHVNKNMDSSQKLQMGGATAVRAYDVGTGQVDSGDILTLELRNRWDLPSGTFLGDHPVLTVGPFYDHGRGQQYKDNQYHLPNNDFSLSGAGLFVSLGDFRNYEASVTWAYRTGNVDPVSGQDDRSRLWLSFNKYF